MRALVLTLVLGVGCVEPWSPDVTVRITGASASQREAIFAGARLWEAIGFRIHDGTGPGWDVEIAVVTFSLGGPYGEAFIDQNRAIIENHDPAAWPMAAVAGHELGHLILRAPGHLPTGEMGLMAAGATTPELTTADHAFACASIGMGCP